MLTNGNTKINLRLRRSDVEIILDALLTENDRLGEEGNWRAGIKAIELLKRINRQMIPQEREHRKTLEKGLTHQGAVAAKIVENTGIKEGNIYFVKDVTLVGQMLDVDLTEDKR